MQGKTHKRRKKSLPSLQSGEILESISDGLFALDRDWRFIYVNKRAAGIVNLEPEDLLGQNIWEKYPQLLGTELERKYRQAMESGQPREFDMQGIGGQTWFHIRVYPSDHGISVFWQDITEHKRLDEEKNRLTEDLATYNEELLTSGEEIKVKAEELEKAHQETLAARDKYLELYNSAPVGYVTLDLQGRILEVNLALLALLGEEKSHLMNSPFSKVVTPESGDEFYFCLKSTRELKTAQICRLQLRRRDASRVDVRLDSLAITDAEGHVANILMTVLDITERKRAEQELKENEEKYHSLFDNMTESFVLLEPIFDPQGEPYDFRILEINKAGADLVGLSEEGTKGKTFLEIDPRYESHWKEVFSKVFLTGEPTRIEQYNGYLDKWLNVYIYVPRKGMIAAISTDITERKNTEAERKRLADRRRHLLNLSQIIMAEKDLGALLTKIAKAAQVLTGARIAASGHGFINGQFRIGGAFWMEGESPCPPGTSFHMEKGGVYQELIEGKESIRLTHDELTHHPAWWGLPGDHTPLKGLLGARLVDDDGQSNGIIMVSDKISGEFTAEDEHFLRQLATIVSLALQHIEARQEVEEKAEELENKVKERTASLAQANEQLNQYASQITRVQEEERRRVARELHDDTAPSISILGLELDAIISSGKVDSPEVLDKLRRLRKDTDRTVQDVRRFSHELMPGVLEHLGLEAALLQLVEDTRERTGLNIQFELRGEECSTDEEKKLALFRISQEALNNIRQHSKATEVNIILDCSDSQISLIVADNGQGFDWEKESGAAAARGSLGLITMQERAKLIGADLKIKSQPRKGTIVTVKTAA